MENKNAQTITDEHSKTLTASKQSPLKKESDRGREPYNCIFQSFLKIKRIHHYSRLTDKGPPVAKSGIRAMRNLLKNETLIGFLSFQPSLNIIITLLRAQRK